MLNQMKKKIIYIDANNLYGHCMSQPLPFDEIKFEKDNCLKEIKITPNDNEIGFFRSRFKLSI